MSNGLNNLDKRREERKRQARTVPQPKHPRSEQEQAEPAAATEAPAPDPAPRRPPEAAEAERTDARRSGRPPSIEAYLDQELMDGLWAVESAAVARRERGMQSPVVRLALRELFDRYTPEQIVDEVLKSAPPRTGKRGRPRR